MTGRIKTTIITGFLGSGKTTFINRLLKDYPDREFAVVENEFGEVSVDTRLIRGVNASHLFELKNGCICCTIVDEYELVLQELAERFPSTQELLIETTGVADPAEVIAPFFKSPVIRELYELQGIICMADARNHVSHGIHPLAVRQMAISDILCITKEETMPAEDLATFTGQLRKLHPFSRIISSASTTEPFPLQNYREHLPERFIFQSSGMTVLHLGITSKTLRFAGPLDRPAFEAWLAYLLDVYNRQIFRVKGIVAFRNEPFEYIVQAVGNNWEITEGDILHGEPEGVLVFIGRLEEVSFEGI
jgi:G3E family GTPase